MNKTFLLFLLFPLLTISQAITGPLEICAGNPAFYSVPPPPSNGQVYWSITPGSGLIAETLGDTAVGDQITVFWNLGFTGLFQLRALYELDGCKGEAVVIYPVPKVINYGFTGEQMVCSSSYETYSVDFSDGDKYEWSILTPDLGSISEYPQDHEVEVLWNNVTAPTVALIELSMEKCGTRHIQQFPVTIMPSPTISINAPLIACRGEIINFSLNGLNSWTNITWDFGDGGVGSGPNPNYVYNGLNTNGTNYTVRVTASDPNDCLNPSTATLDIQIQPAPVTHLTPAINHYFCDVAAIAANPPTLYLTVDNNYAAATKITWFHNTNPITTLPPMTTSYSPADFGQYYAIVESAQGCSDTTNVVSINQSDCNGNGNDPCIIVELSPTITSVNMTACNTGTATAVTNGSLAPISTLWMLDDILLPGQTTGTANFTVSGVGIHRISYHETYNNGIQSGGGTCDYSVGDVMEFIVPYETQLEYSITCSSSGNGYDVTLYDASDYFPTTPIQGLEYYVDSVNIPQASNLGQYTITNLAPGSYSLMLEIVGSGYSPCTTTRTIDLPALPTAIINAPIEACAGEPVQFSASVNDPNLTYLWEFDDGAKNSLPDPIRNFGPSLIPKIVTLTVTNGLGCSTTVSHTITINALDMEGTLELNPATACYGDVINIEYFPDTGSNIPSSYVWSHEVNGTIVSTQTTNVNNIDVTQPGIYILDGVDANGCIQYGIDRIAVSFLERPTAGISGPQGVCADEEFQLQARPVFENHYLYNWQLDGQPLPQWDNEPVITEAIATPGNYTYEVTVTAPSGCTDTASFDLEVFAIPEPPSVSIAVEDCDPYLVHLSANHGEQGSFLWSDGQSGKSIIVNHGGPYRVTFIDENGCSSSTDFDVPHNPDAFIWVYPQGCYEVCEQNANLSYVTGPVIPFEWEWQVDSNPFDSGNSVMPQQYYYENGLYQLQLGSGTCLVTAPGFTWTMVENCEECELDINILNIRAEADSEGNCYFIVFLDITNNSIPLSYIINNTSGTGVIIPGGGYLPNGTTNLELEFYPEDGFLGGSVDFTLVGTSAERFLKCLKDFSITFPPCPTGSHRPQGEEPFPETGKYSIVPNPTTGMLTIGYPVEKTDKGGQELFIYDMLGREIKRETLNSVEGKTNIDIGEFANGVYLLNIRKEEKTLLFKRIILSK